MSNPWDPNRYKKLDEEADSFLENLKRSQWTPFIIAAFVICVILLAYALAS